MLQTKTDGNDYTSLKTKTDGNDYTSLKTKGLKTNTKLR